MATYAIGDIQGCYQPLLRLLDKIQFNEKQDTLWFAGDIINRGPASLDVIRFVSSLGDQHKMVLGNHDLHWLAVVAGVRKEHTNDTLKDLLQAPDCMELAMWLRQQPLLLEDQGYVLVHAGLAPMWTLAQAKALAKEVELELQSENWERLLQGMFGNEPSLWRDDLKDDARIRCIVNYLTRMRYCAADGSLDLLYKGPLPHPQPEMMPWFEVPGRKNADVKIIFGHWAALEGKTSLPNLYALDTGCVWGALLTAMRLEDGERISVRA